MAESSPRLLVVGTGLIGTSLGLAASRGGYDVVLRDRDPARVATAVRMGAGTAAEQGPVGCDIAVVAVPPPAVAQEVLALLRSEVDGVVTHVASIQSGPLLDIETGTEDLDRFVGGHPIAGTERSGPHNGAADLFEGRPWVVCPTSQSRPEAVVAVTRLATACGAAVTTMSAARHDELLARLSHVPQLVASALAAALTGLEPAESALGGSGIQDTTRIADSDPQLWASIIGGNAAAVARALHDVVSPLVDVMHRLASDRAAGDGAAAVSALVEQGRSGRARLAGKHGERAVRWATVSVVVPDEPGSLARLLADAGDAGVNVEDIRVDHAPGRALGLVELAVDPDAATRLRDALATARWTATVDLPTGARPPGA